MEHASTAGGGSAAATGGLVDTWKTTISWSTSGVSATTYMGPSPK